MQNEILEKLKVKKTPKLQKPVVVNVPEKKINVSINATIIDNNVKTNIDRDEFLKNINASRRIIDKRTKIDQPIPDEPKPDEPKPDEPKPDAEPEVEPDNVTIPQTTPSKPSKIKKLSLKIKLNTDDPTVLSNNTARRTKLPKGIADVGPISMVEVKGETFGNRIAPKKEINKIKASAYYLNNRQIFVNFVTGIFNKYKLDIAKHKKNASCDKTDEDGFKLMSHQKLVRDYISNLLSRCAVISWSRFG